MTDSTDLLQLAQEINAEHDRCMEALSAGLEHALKVGRLLIQAKSRVCHGEWGAWINANCDFSTRTAQAYMKVACELPHRKTQRVAQLSFRRAVKLVTAGTTACEDDAFSEKATEASEFFQEAEGVLNSPAATTAELLVVRNRAAEYQQCFAEYRIRKSREIGKALTVLEAYKRKCRDMGVALEVRT